MQGQFRPRRGRSISMSVKDDAYRPRRWNSVERQHWRSRTANEEGRRRGGTYGVERVSSSKDRVVVAVPSEGNDVLVEHAGLLALTVLCVGQVDTVWNQCKPEGPRSKGKTEGQKNAPESTTAPLASSPPSSSYSRPTLTVSIPFLPCITAQFPSRQKKVDGNRGEGDVRVDPEIARAGVEEEIEGLGRGADVGFAVDPAKGRKKR